MTPEIHVRLDSSPPSLKQRLGYYIRLVRLDRPIGIMLLMWPALWALWIAADGQPPWRIVLIFMLGAVLMRSAGCAINDYADRNLDGQVRRTCKRPLALGLISPREAIMVFAVLALAAFGLVLLLNWQTIALSLVAVTLAALYPFMKRYTHLPQIFLGAAFGWAVPMAFMAIQETVPPVGWLIFIVAVVWALIYDTEYAMVDRKDDLKAGIKSSAILFGLYDRLMIGILQAAMLGILALVGLKADLGLYYYLGLGLAGLHAVRQQILIRSREESACFTAFLENNLFGMVIFVGVLADALLGQ